MKYKLIVSDFDGTLFRRDYTIAPATVKAIKDYMAAGGIFTIATGRMYDSIRQYLDMAGLGDCNLLISGYQGQMINESLTGRVLKLDGFDKATALDLLATLKDIGVYHHIYALDDKGVDRIYAKEPHEHLSGYAKHCRVEPVIVGDLSNFVRSLDADAIIMKILMILPKSEVTPVKAKLEKIYKGRAQFVSAAEHMLDALVAGGGKHTAVQFMSEYYKIPKEQIVCVGDENNDISMIQYAGLGCAVGNAVESAKAAAKLVLPGCDDDAIGCLIRDHIMSN